MHESIDLFSFKEQKRHRAIKGDDLKIIKRFLIIRLRMFMQICIFMNIIKEMQRFI